MVKTTDTPLFDVVPTGVSIDKQKQEFTIKTNALTTAELVEIINEAIAFAKPPTDEDDVGEIEFRKKLKDKINDARNTVLVG